MDSYFVHPTSVVDSNCRIGNNSKIWHWSHLSNNCIIGENCTIGQNVFIGENVKVGNNVKIQNNVSIFSGVEIEDYVFCGPSCVFTNVRNPRSTLPRNKDYEKTLVKKNTTIGANSTILCGLIIGKYSFVAAGSVVTKDVCDHALVLGNPARHSGWVSESGFKLDKNYYCNVEKKTYNFLLKKKSHL